MVWSSFSRVQNVEIVNINKREVYAGTKSTSAAKNRNFHVAYAQEDFTKSLIYANILLDINMTFNEQYTQYFKTVKHF